MVEKAHETATQSNEGLVSRLSAARELGVATTTLDRWGRDGYGPQKIKYRRQVFYRRAELERWLNTCAIPQCGSHHAGQEGR